MPGGGRDAGALAVKPTSAAADTTSVQITRKTKLYGGIGLGVVLVALVFKLLVLKPPKPVTAPPPLVHHATPHRAATARIASHAKRVPPAPKIDPTLPAPLRVALRHHAVVVAVLYAPGVPGDNAAVASAESGASAAHAGFAVLNVRNEGIAKALATKLPGSSDPSVVVVSRPGDIKFLVNGYLDGAAVAQAARDFK